MSEQMPNAGMTFAEMAAKLQALRSPTALEFGAAVKRAFSAPAGS